MAGAEGWRLDTTLSPHAANVFMCLLAWKNFIIANFGKSCEKKKLKNAFLFHFLDVFTSKKYWRKFRLFIVTTVPNQQTELGFLQYCSTEVD